MDQKIRKMIEKERFEDAFSAADRLYFEGRSEESHEIYDEIYDTVSERYGRDSQQAFNAMLDLADFDKKTGRFSEALRLYDIYLNYQKEQPGGKDAGYYDIFKNKADIYVSCGRFEEAAEMRQEILSFYLEKEGESSPETVKAFGALAAAHMELGHMEEALSLYLQQIEMAKAAQADEGTLSFIYRYTGRCYAVLKDTEKTYEYEKKALELAVKAYGEMSGEVHAVQNELLNYYIDSGKLDKALETAEKNAANAAVIFGTEHENYYLSYVSLGNVRRMNGEYDKAEADILKGLEGLRKLFGEDHPDTVYAEKCLSEVYTKQERLEEALELKERIYETSVHIYGEDHPETLAQYVNIGYVYLMMNQFSAASDIFENAYERARQICGLAFPSYPALITDLAMSLLETEEYDKAIHYLNELLEMLEELPANAETKDPKYLCLLSEALEGAKRYEEALEVMQKCRQKYEDEFGAFSKDEKYLYVLKELAAAHYKAGDYEEALKLLEYAIAAQEKYSAYYPSKYDKYVLLGEIYTSQGRLAEAEKIVGDIIQKGTHSQEIFYCYACILMRSGYYEQTLQLCSTCLKRAYDEGYADDTRTVRRLSELASRALILIKLKDMGGSPDTE